MIITQPYVSLSHTLLAMKVQVIDSMPYVSDYIDNSIQTPEELFYTLKPLLTYKKDPHQIELLQTFQTLMEQGGKGDCDCFTIASLACFFYLHFKPCYLTLAGNTLFSPSHVYAEVYDNERGEICAFDLTNPYYDMERPYKFKQRLLFRL